MKKCGNKKAMGGRVKSTTTKAGFTKSKRRYSSGGSMASGNSYKCGGKMKK